MTITNLINDIERLQGNLTIGNGVYISALNMDRFSERLEGIDTTQGILVTPYLIMNKSMRCELLYYEFDVEVRGKKTHYVDYNPNNLLPAEITENLKPQIIIAVGDKNSYKNAVKKYLTNMSKMEFAVEKEHYPELQNAQLFFQIFTDSELD